jgi:hypothetical protein
MEFAVSLYALGSICLARLAVIVVAMDEIVMRIQIGIDKDEYDLVKTQAAALGISIAEFIRRAVRERLPVSGQGAWMKYAGLVTTGDPNSSRSIDEIVYGSND